MGEDPEARKITSQLEARWIAFLTAVAMFFGGWWLQNQYQTTQRLQSEFLAFTQRVDDKYVEKDFLGVIAARLARIEASLDALNAAAKYPPTSGPR
jgi:hypothetical protein